MNENAYMLKIETISAYYYTCTKPENLNLHSTRTATTAIPMWRIPLYHVNPINAGLANPKFNAPHL